MAHLPKYYFDAYDLFKRGFDTFEIAEMLGASEASILRSINQARSAMLGRRYPYKPYKVPKPEAAPKNEKTLVKAAGCK